MVARKPGGQIAVKNKATEEGMSMGIVSMGIVSRWIVASLAGSLLISSSPAGPAASPANLVLNPGFEEGVVDGNPRGWEQQAESDAEGTVSVVEDQAHGGRCSVLVEHRNQKGYLHPSHSVTVPPGSYRYRLWAKSDADLSFVMQIYDKRLWLAHPAPEDLQAGGLTSREFRLVKDTWQCCEIPVDVTAEFPASLQIGLREAGRLWLDDVELLPGPPRLVLASAAEPLHGKFTPEELRNRKLWSPVQDRGTAIRSAAWLGNEHVGLLFRQGSPSASFYAAMPDGRWTRLSELTPAGAKGERAQAIRSFQIHELYPDKIVLEVTSASASGKPLTVRYQLETGKRFVEAAAREGAERLSATSGAKFAVVPDAFGGDLVVSAARTPAAHLRLPRDRMLLQCVENGDAILMFTWLSPDQEVTATLSGEGADRAVASTEIGFRREQRAGIWIAALAAPAIWQAKPVAELTEMAGNKLERPLPFPAAWRVNFRRLQDGLIDPWTAVSQQKDGNWEGCRDNGSRTLWTSCRNDVNCPAFVQDGSLHLVNTSFPGAMQATYFPGAEDLSFDPADVALAYPWERNDLSPADAPVPREIIRQALATTPEFEYYGKLAPIDMPRHRYPATCAVTAEYEKAFEQGEEGKLRRQLIADLRRMDFFVLTKRERIEEYMTWMRDRREWLQARKVREPELTPLAGRFDEFLSRMQQTYAEGRGTRMKTPADCQELVDRVEALLDQPAPAAPAASGADAGSGDRLALIQDLGKQTRSIGGAQDSVLGCLRQIVKELRQTAGCAMLAASSNAEFDFARQMRDATLDLLWQTCGHEWR